MKSFTAKDTKDAKEEKSLTAKDAKDTKEKKSLTTKDAKDAKAEDDKAQYLGRFTWDASSGTPHLGRL